jgi:hypothetical protein
MSTLKAFYVENFKNKITCYDMAVTIFIANFNIVEYLLKARIVELEKQPLLANGFETTFVSK